MMLEELNFKPQIDNIKRQIEEKEKYLGELHASRYSLSRQIAPSLLFTAVTIGAGILIFCLFRR